MYMHITRDDRVVISDGLRRGESYAVIGNRVGKDKSAVWNEVKRNADSDGAYHAWHADRRAHLRRRHAKYAIRTIENDSALAQRIEARLHPLVSPEVIAYDEEVCHETIYAWIARSRPDLAARLPQRGRKRRRYGSKRGQKQGWTRNVRAIKERFPGAERRSRTGHFEGDTLRGRNGALLTHTDRKSRFEIAQLVANEGADAAHAAITANPHLGACRSITYDRGGTFALWRMIERDTKATVYFADPHAPWQRGTNENANGRLRRVFPKRFDFGTITQRDVDGVAHLMNHTKRKCLKWRTPCEVFRRCCTSS